MENSILTFQNMTTVTFLITNIYVHENFSKICNHPKFGLKEVKLPHFTHQYTKKKKNLSK